MRRARGHAIIPIVAGILMAAPSASAAGGPPGTGVAAADPGAERVRRAVTSHLDRHRAEVLRELMDLLAIPNLASDAPNIARNADHLAAMLRRRGIETRLLTIDGRPPVVYGTAPSPGARRTVVFYAHYDGQPVRRSDWSSDPWKPVLRDGVLGRGGREIAPPAEIPAGAGEWRLYARSASDDKAPIVALLAALDALRAGGIAPSVNVRIFLEGEEEAGSPHLGRILEHHRDLLAADLWLMCDGPVHPSRRMQLYFGARGIIDLEITLYGPLRPLHSGHYGNWAPNPLAGLTRLLAAMRGPDGDILIPGIDDDVRPITRAERRALDRIPDGRAALQDELAVARPEGGGRTLEELVMRPAMNLRGLRGGAVGEEASNAIPTEATASIDFRLVPDQTPDGLRAKVESFLKVRGLHIVHDEPDAATRRAHPEVIRLRWGHGYPPARVPLDLPASRALVRVMEEATGGPIIALPTLGGSGPLYLFEEVLGSAGIGVPIVNHDNNQHAADENLRLQNLWDGIGVYAAALARLGQVWDAPPESAAAR